MQQQVGVHRLLERRAERRDQRVRQLADEPDGVRQGDRPDRRQVEPARRRVERREQLVGGVRPGARQRVEQRRLAGVGVADDRDREHLAAHARAALHRALPAELLEPLLQHLDPPPDQPPVGLELRLARAAQADAALLALEVGPAAHQARREVLRAGRARPAPCLRGSCARCAKMSRMSVVRSTTRRSSRRSRLRCCAGESSWLKITSVAPVSAHTRAISSTLPEPAKSAGSGRLRRPSTTASTRTPALAARRHSSSRLSA